MKGDDHTDLKKIYREGGELFDVGKHLFSIFRAIAKNKSKSLANKNESLTISTELKEDLYGKCLCFVEI